jgi:FSR family fosmidomycin resistance protein-like MFS transporter
MSTLQIQRVQFLSLPALLGLAHGVSDGAAGLLLGSLTARLPLPQVGALVMLYNVLAFACQPLFGFVADKLGQSRLFAAVGLALVALGMVMAPAHTVVAVVLAGIGSGMFHVGGGALALTASQGRADGAGVFASPGVLGLAIGGGLAAAGHTPFGIFALALLVLMGYVLRFSSPPQRGQSSSRSLPIHARVADAGVEIDNHDMIMIALLAGIALRSAVWTTFEQLMHGRADVLLMVGVAAFAGKLAGGFLADRIGWRTWTLGALIGAAGLLTFATNNIVALLLGVTLLQSATPAALAATARLLPRYPATAAGLALGLAIGIGGLPAYSGVAIQIAPHWVALGGACAAALALAYGLHKINHVVLPRE